MGKVNPLKGRGVNWLHFAIQVQPTFFRPPGPTAAGRVGLYILLLYFIFYFFWHRNL